MSAAELGKLLIVGGVVIIVIGVILMSNATIPFLGKLPGDIYVQKENFSFHFPLTTCIVVSIVLSLIFMLFLRR